MTKKLKINADNMSEEELLRFIDEGYEDYKQGNYEDAQKVFEEFRKKHENEIIQNNSLCE